MLCSVFYCCCYFFFALVSLFFVRCVWCFVRCNLLTVLRHDTLRFSFLLLFFCLLFSHVVCEDVRWLFRFLLIVCPLCFCCCSLYHFPVRFIVRCSVFLFVRLFVGCSVFFLLSVPFAFVVVLFITFPRVFCSLFSLVVCEVVRWLFSFLLLVCPRCFSCCSLYHFLALCRLCPSFLSDSFLVPSPALFHLPVPRHILWTLSSFLSEKLSTSHVCFQRSTV